MTILPCRSTAARVHDRFRALSLQSPVTCTDGVVGRHSADSLEEATPEVRAFEGAFDLLRDQGLVEQLKADIADLPAHPLAEEILTDADRADLPGTVL